MQIGFIGLGHMGKPMAQRLIENKHQLVVYDINPQASETLKTLGAHCAANAGDVAPGSDFVITMLQSHQQVTDCCCQQYGVFNQIDPNHTLYIDCSTIDIAASKQLHQQAKQAGIRMVDAPVSGGVIAAEQGTLTFMAGGDTADVKQVAPLLQQLGKAVIHAGEGGSGAAAKICNNLILAISMIAVSEGFALAEQLNLIPEKLFEICSQSSAQCWSLNQYCPYPNILEQSPSSHDYRPGFSTAMMLKDLKLAKAAASNTDTTLAMLEQAHQLYQKLFDYNSGEKDFSQILKLLRNQKLED